MSILGRIFLTSSRSALETERVAWGLGVPISDLLGENTEGDKGVMGGAWKDRLCVASILCSSSG